MIPTIVSRHGEQDGIRWGVIEFPRHVQRRFHHDRLTGAVRLYRPSRIEGAKPVEDVDPERLAMARAALAE